MRFPDLKTWFGWFNFVDIIGAIALLYSLYLIGCGKDHLVSGIAIAIVAAYFTRRYHDGRNSKTR